MEVTYILYVLKKLKQETKTVLSMPDQSNENKLEKGAKPTLSDGGILGLKTPFGREVVI